MSLGGAPAGAERSEKGGLNFWSLSAFTQYRSTYEIRMYRFHFCFAFLTPPLTHYDRDKTKEILKRGTHCHASLLDLPLTRVLQTKTVFFVGGSVAEVGAKPTAARAWLSPRCRLTCLMRKH